jgi:preprotein translocase subunit SecE
MAKTRAQRKAERRAREAEERKRSDGERGLESRAQHNTQVPVSGDIAEIEAVEAGIAAGASEGQLETPDAPKPRSARRAKAKAEKEAEKRERSERKRRESEQLARKQKQATKQPSAGGQRGGVIGFLVSCWAELKKVQWPDRETLIQATAVTILFVAVAAIYLGVLDWFFNLLVKRIL